MSRSPPDRRGALERGRSAFLARQNGSGCGQWATVAPPHQPAQTEAAECKRCCGSDIRRIRARARRVHLQVMMLAAGLRSRWAPAPGRRRAFPQGPRPRPRAGAHRPSAMLRGHHDMGSDPGAGRREGRWRGGRKRPPRPPGQNRAGRPARTRRAGQTVGGTSPGRRRASNFRPRQGRLGGH
jgi:hypothetical protein